MTGRFSTKTEINRIKTSGTCKILITTYQPEDITEAIRNEPSLAPTSTRPISNSNDNTYFPKTFRNADAMRICRAVGGFSPFLARSRKNGKVSAKDSLTLSGMRRCHFSFL